MSSMNDGFPPITRRDFVNGALVGTGAALLGGCGGRSADPQTSPWTGYGGVGDYANANGNTQSVVDAAHAIRDGKFAADAAAVEDPTSYDVVIVGAGFAGLSAALEIVRDQPSPRRCLVLDNHAIFGGEARQNEFDVDGYRLYAPQGSNDFARPTEAGHEAQLWSELGLPDDFEFAAPVAGRPDAVPDNYGPMYWQAERCKVGYFFPGDPHAASGRWITDIWKDDFTRAPLPPRVRHDLARLWNLRERPYAGADFAQWLDGMTYKSFLIDVLKLHPQVTVHVDPLLAVADYGFGSDVISAYAAFKAWLPGVRSFLSAEALAAPVAELLSFPGGNTAILRHFIKRLLPDAIEGDASFARVLEGRVNFSALDRAGSAVRIRLSSTAVRIAHDSDGVGVTYLKDGKLHRVRARGVVMACGGWVARRVLRDLPAPMAAAFAEFHHGPILVANVALRNWRFLDRLGFTAARWFEGFGFFANIRRPMKVGGIAAPFHPDRPIVMTFYVPFLQPGHDIRTQGVLARTQLFSRTYRQFEEEILGHMRTVFGAAGFDAARDVAGIVLNRWGHAFIAPQPGFLLGRDGAPSPLDVVKRGYGRIRFGHSELSGAQNWPSAASEGARAAKQVLAIL